MTQAVIRLLADFDALPVEDRRQAVIEILRRATTEDESALTELAAELFVTYDA